MSIMSKASRGKANRSKANRIAPLVGVLAVLGALWVVLPRNDLCADTIRGFKERASAAVDIIRTGYDSLKGALGTESVLEVPQIENLNALNFSVLRACDTHCQLLMRCLRFVFLKPPSEACPREYDDLLKTQRRAEGVLERLAMIERQTKDAQAQVPAIKEARTNVEELQRAGGATGSQLALAEAKQRQLEDALSGRLRSISSQLSELDAQ